MARQHGREMRCSTQRPQWAASRALSRGSHSPTSASEFQATRASRSPGVPPGYTDQFAPVAQGIERCPAEAEAASSNLAGRIELPPQTLLHRLGKIVRRVADDHDHVD